MNKYEVIIQLKHLIILREQAWTSLDRKRSLRPSEKAMAKANIDRDIKAIEFALKCINKS